MSTLISHQHQQLNIDAKSVSSSSTAAPGFPSSSSEMMSSKFAPVYLTHPITTVSNSVSSSSSSSSSSITAVTTATATAAAVDRVDHRSASMSVQGGGYMFPPLATSNAGLSLAVPVPVTVTAPPAPQFGQQQQQQQQPQYDFRFGVTSGTFGASGVNRSASCSLHRQLAGSAQQHQQHAQLGLHRINRPPPIDTQQLQYQHQYQHQQQHQHQHQQQFNFYGLPVMTPASSSSSSALSANPFGSHSGTHTPNSCSQIPGQLSYCSTLSLDNNQPQLAATTTMGLSYVNSNSMVSHGPVAGTLNMSAYPTPITANQHIQFHQFQLQQQAQLQQQQHAQHQHQQQQQLPLSAVASCSPRRASVFVSQHHQQQSLPLASTSAELAAAKVSAVKTMPISATEPGWANPCPSPMQMCDIVGSTSQLSSSALIPNGISPARQQLLLQQQQQQQQQQQHPQLQLQVQVQQQHIRRPLQPLGIQRVSSVHYGSNGTPPAIPVRDSSRVLHNQMHGSSLGLTQIGSSANGVTRSASISNPHPSGRHASSRLGLADHKSASSGVRYAGKRVMTEHHRALQTLHQPQRSLSHQQQPVTAQPVRHQPTALLQALLGRERAHLPNRWYLEQIQKFSSARTSSLGKLGGSALRTHLVEMMHTFNDNINPRFHNETVFMGVTFMDRYLSVERVTQLQRFQLVAVCCFYLGAKCTEEIREPTTRLYQEAVGVQFSTDQIKRMEAKILHALEWNLVDVTPHTVAQQILQSLVPGRSAHTISASVLMANAEMFWATASKDIRSVGIRASVLAVAGLWKAIVSGLSAAAIAARNQQQQQYQQQLCTCKTNVNMPQQRPLQQQHYPSPQSPLDHVACPIHSAEAITVENISSKPAAILARWQHGVSSDILPSLEDMMSLTDVTVIEVVEFLSIFDVPSTSPLSTNMSLRNTGSNTPSSVVDENFNCDIQEQQQQQQQQQRCEYELGDSNLLPSDFCDEFDNDSFCGDIDAPFTVDWSPSDIDSLSAF